MVVRRSGRWGAGEASYQGGAPHTVGPLDRAVSVSGFGHGFGQRVSSLGDQGAGGAAVLADASVVLGDGSQTVALDARVGGAGDALTWLPVVATGTSGVGQDGMPVNEALPTLTKLPSVGASPKLCKTGPSLPPGDWLGSRRRSCGRRRRRLEKESFPTALPLIFRFSARNADLCFKPRRSEAELRLGFSIRRLPSLSAVSLLSRNSSDEQPVDDDL